MAKGLAFTRSVRPGRRARPPSVRILQSDELLEVWLCENGEPRHLTGTIPVELAFDARRLGQDLVGELVDEALKEAERQSTAL